MLICHVWCRRETTMARALRRLMWRAGMRRLWVCQLHLLQAKLTEPSLRTAHTDGQRRDIGTMDCSKCRRGTWSELVISIARWTSSTASFLGVSACLMMFRRLHAVESGDACKDFWYSRDLRAETGLTWTRVKQLLHVLYTALGYVMFFMLLPPCWQQRMYYWIIHPKYTFHQKSSLHNSPPKLVHAMTSPGPM